MSSGWRTQSRRSGRRRGSCRSFRGRVRRAGHAKDPQGFCMSSGSCCKIGRWTCASTVVCAIYGVPDDGSVNTFADDIYRKLLVDLRVLVNSCGKEYMVGEAVELIEEEN